MKETKFCINCGKEIPAGSTFCPYCSAWQENKLPEPEEVNKAQVDKTTEEKEPTAENDLTETFKVIRPDVNKKSMNGEPTGTVVEIGSSKEDAEKTKKLEEMAYHDELTKLYNRQKFKEVKETIKASDLCSFISIDINDLKKTNDTYGHEAGDQYINNMARVLRTLAPKESYRMGGDEFLVLLRGADMNAADKLALRIKAMLKDLKDDPDNGFVPVAAIGVTEKKPGEEFQAAYRRADDLMYENKKAYKEKQRQKLKQEEDKEKKQEENTGSQDPENGSADIKPATTVINEKVIKVYESPSESIRRKQDEYGERIAKENYYAKKKRTGRVIRGKLSETVFFTIIFILLIWLRMKIG